MQFVCAFSLVYACFWYVQLFVFFLWKCIVHRLAIFGHRCKGTNCYTSDSGRCFAPRPPVCSFVKLLWWTLLHLRCLDEIVADMRFWRFEDRFIASKYYATAIKYWNPIALESYGIVLIWSQRNYTIVALSERKLLWNELILFTTMCNSTPFWKSCLRR